MDDAKWRSRLEEVLKELCIKGWALGDYDFAVEMELYELVRMKLWRKERIIS